MSEEDLLKVEGFKKMAKKLKTNIASSIEKANLIQIMAASGKFGRELEKENSANNGCVSRYFIS